MVEEYSNDLYSRLWIELAWPMFTERVRIAHQPRLAELDDRFRAATIHDAGKAVGHFRKPEDAALWWTQRRPRKATGQFAIDLGMS